MPRRRAGAGVPAIRAGSDRGWEPPARRRVYAIRDRLRLVYGIPILRPHGDGLAELILTVLSQSTNDRNRDIAYFGLRERFPSWEEVRDAPVDEVEEAIRRGGISKVKSARIKAILAAVTDTGPEPGAARAGLGVPASRCRRRRGTSARCRAWAARPPPACCCSPTGCATCRSTPTSHVSARGSGCSGRRRRSRSCTTRCSR